MVGKRTKKINGLRGGVGFKFPSLPSFKLKKTKTVKPEIGRTAEKHTDPNYQRVKMATFTNPMFGYNQQKIDLMHKVVNNANHIKKNFLVTIKNPNGTKRTSYNVNKLIEHLKTKPGVNNSLAKELAQKLSNHGITKTAKELGVDYTRPKPQASTGVSKQTLNSIRKGISGMTNKNKDYGYIDVKPGVLKNTGYIDVKHGNNNAYLNIGN